MAGSSLEHTCSRRSSDGTETGTCGVRSSSSDCWNGTLVEVPPPPARLQRGERTPAFRGRKRGDQAERDAKNRDLGLAGELLVVRYEIGQLAAAGRHDLAERVRHVAILEGDGAGYDVASFTLGGEAIYIEVKTTRGPADASCFTSSHELAFAKVHAASYRLYRVFDYDPGTDAGRLFVMSGNPSDNFECVPTVYRMGTQVVSNAARMAHDLS